ncbi:MAG: formylglycine-generating enzyme family protein [Deltaproteobacteria bacterium]|nr:formylglycine-generating enzyme family protein [Deltaproteobacteria bacterium]
MRVFRRREALIFLMAALAAAVVARVPEGETSARPRNFVNSLDMEFVLIPAGSFTMGSPLNEAHRDRDERLHEVTITRPFYIQTTEVTLGQWWEVMGKKLFGRRKGVLDDPVVSVSWFDCMEFIEKLNERGEGTYRLPTEAEWEYACRAGTTTAYSWGDEPACSRAMYSNNPLKSEACIPHVKSMGLEPGKAAPVKSYDPNPWGLYDMHGNVWEWCSDWYGAYPEESVEDPTGPANGNRRVRRSGSWYKYPWYCRSANRNIGHPAIKHDTLGFRVVREAE